jgi:ATP-dependent Lon protease
LETIFDLPWKTGTVDNNELKQAELILNRDHSGLEKVKRRILEYLAVRALRGNSKGEKPKKKINF